MPHHTLTYLHAIWDALPEPVKAAILGALIALLRVMYDDREPRLIRRLLEAALCGAIAFGVGSGAEAMGTQPGLAMFLGGAIGLLGADKVRELGRRYIGGKISEERKR